MDIAVMASNPIFLCKKLVTIGVLLDINKFKVLWCGITLYGNKHVVKLDPDQCALVVLRAIEERGQRRGKPLTRARVSGASLKALCIRETITPEWLNQVNEWLLSAGWILIEAGGTYGAIKVTVVENWPRVASAHMQDELTQIKLGKFDFKKWNRLLDKAAWEDTTATKVSKKTRKAPSRQ